jgi:hypothetical protein
LLSLHHNCFLPLSVKFSFQIPFISLQIFFCYYEQENVKFSCSFL